MAAADALSKYLQQVRFQFPKGFSKHFYKGDENTAKTEEEIKGLDETLKDDLLVDVINAAMRIQTNDNDLTYWRLVKEFGFPVKLMIELLWENLPEEELEHFRRKLLWIGKKAVVCVTVLIVALSIFTGCTLAYRSNVNIREENTIFIKDNGVPSAKESIDIMNFFQTSEAKEIP